MLRLLLFFLIGCHVSFIEAGIKFKTRETLTSDNVRLVADYGTFRVYETLTQGDLSNVSGLAGFQLLNMDTLKLDHFPIDTMVGVNPPPSTMAWEPARSRYGSLQLIQFAGPIRTEWLDAVRETGAKLVHYIADNGYLIWADARAETALARMQNENPVVQFHGAYLPHYKLGTNLVSRFEGGMKEADGLLKVTVQLYNHEGSKESEMILEDLVVERLTNWTPILKYKNTVVRVHAEDIPVIASLADVYWIGERTDRILHDEVQAQILAGHLDDEMGGPSGTGYLDWLISRGISQDPEDYPILTVVDDGVGNGSVLSGDPTFHREGILSNASRLAFVDNCTSQSSGAGLGGHGHINWSIAMGFDDRTGQPYQDGDGYRRGLGINPFGRGASTRIFGPIYDLSNCGRSDMGVIRQSYLSGARLSSNSWGCSGCASQYDDSSQAYDVGIRDADLDTPGNQQFPHFFSAGNSGAGSATIGTPGNGKNMITVGASENDRATWTDGCGVNEAGADDAMDVIDFSSRGPAPGGRVKPEVIAPGTHIQGTASTYKDFNGTTVCDAAQPAGQTIFAASSGTSHSTPAVAGFGSLVYYFLQNIVLVDHNQVDYQPSPSMMKAYLIAHAGTYLTGVSAGDTLPSNIQGYGMPHLGQALDLDTPRLLIDEATVMDQTGTIASWSGVIGDAGKPVRIVLAYTDAAGAIGTSPQVNDLDLEVLVNGETYLGNHFDGAFSITGGVADPDNNYEAVFLPAGVTGSVEIRVIASNIGGDGVPNFGDDTDQDFSIATYNLAQRPDYYLRPELTSSSLCAPETLSYDVAVGGFLGYSDDVSLSLADVPAGLNARVEPTTVTPGGTVTLTFENTESVVAGNYRLALNATSTSGSKTVYLELAINNRVPLPVTPLSPVNEAFDRGQRLELVWTADEQVSSYELEVSTDASFEILTFNTQTMATQVTVEGLDLYTVYYWRVKASNICGEGIYGDTYSFVTGGLPQPFSEYYSTDEFDLENTTLTWIPNDGPDGYSLCIERDVTRFPVDTVGSSLLSLGDDDNEAVSFGDGHTFPFFGVERDSVFVGANGYLTFGEGDRDYTPSVSDHYRLPRISAMFDDLYPQGSISYRRLTDRFTVTYDGIPELGRDNESYFQISLFFDGQIQITYLGVEALGSMTGLSDGTGQPANYVESDLSEAQCGLRVYAQNVCVDSDFSFLVRPTILVDGETTLSIDGLPEGAEVEITPNPVKPGERAHINITGGTLGAGDYELQLIARTAEATFQTTAQFSGYETVTSPTLLYPENGSYDVPLVPDFVWDGFAPGTRSLLEVARDEAFADVVISNDVAELSELSFSALSSWTTYFWRVTSTNICGSSMSSVNVFHTELLPSFFTQRFQGESDLDFTALTFEQAIGDYSLCAELVDDLPYNPELGTVLPLSDDDFEAVSLVDIGGISFYGNTYETAYVGSNGYITFGSGDSDFSDSFADHFRLPRVSAMFDDLNPGSAGAVRAAFHGDAFVVTWHNVPEFGSSNRNTAQVIFYHDGRVAIVHGNMASTDLTVGLSEGLGYPDTFVESDLSSNDRCLCPGDMNGDRQVDEVDFGEALEGWLTRPVRDVIYDGILNISDLVIMIDNDGTTCP